jgi:hypothetical protein
MASSHHLPLHTQLPCADHVCGHCSMLLLPAHLRRMNVALANFGEPKYGATLV